MIYKTFFVVLFLTSFFVIHGQVKDIYFKSIPEYSSETMFYSGSVTRITDNVPLDSVEIYVEEFGIVGFTNNEGLFKVKAPRNIAKLYFKKLGYIGMSKLFIIDKERSNSMNIKMFPVEPDEKEQDLIQKNYQLNNPNDFSGEVLKNEELLLKTAGIKDVPATIRVLMPDKAVVVMNMDEYLKGVVPAEVPPSWDMNALKAQAVAARSYASTNFKHKSDSADVCTTTHCQAWKSNHYNKTDQAVTETSNVSVKYEGNIITAFFFSHCNGYTRNNEDVWGGTPLPYLRSRRCSCGFTFHNAHGVGMCQYGSQAMASKGTTWDNILTYYYTGTVVDKQLATMGTLQGAIYYGNDNSDLNYRIIGATVKTNTGQQVLSGEYGLYSFDLLPGQYTITASKDGFQSGLVTTNVTIESTSWGSIQLVQPLGFSEVSTAKKYVYPNPAKDILNIEPIGNAQIIITNVTGRTVFNEIKNEKTVVNITNYEPGIYMIKIIGAHYMISEKVVLLH